MKRWMFGLGCLGVLAVGVVALVLTALGLYNDLVKRDEEVNRQWAQVETVYQRRADLVPNLVATVRGAAEFERGTFTDVTEARAKVGSITFKEAPNEQQMAQFMKAQSELRSAIARLLVAVENYPQLRATEAFRDLQVQLEGTENRIAVERQRYNAAVQELNQRLRQVPGVFFQALIPQRAYFDADAGAERAPKVNFGTGNTTGSSGGF